MNIARPERIIGNGTVNQDGQAGKLVKKGIVCIGWPASAEMTTNSAPTIRATRTGIRPRLARHAMIAPEKPAVMPDKLKKTTFLSAQPNSLDDSHGWCDMSSGGETSTTNSEIRRNIKKPPRVPRNTPTWCGILPTLVTIYNVWVNRRRHRACLALPPLSLPASG